MGATAGYISQLDAVFIYSPRYFPKKFAKFEGRA
jgi:hypothetical protein